LFVILWGQPVNAGGLPPDSLVQIHPDPAHTTLEDSVASKPGLVMTKSPAMAVGLSAVLPGAGQFYNESYWKVPIVMGLGGYFVYEWIKNDNLAQDYRDLYEASKTPEDPDGNTQYLAIRDFYKDQRDTFTWYFAILYVANLLDAYVDANLYDFDVGDDLTLRVIPGAQQVHAFVPGVSVRLSF
jgi:hypothetical protein